MRNSYPNRFEKRETNLYVAAEEGKLYINDLLYPSEIKKLEKQGFYVRDVKPSTISPALFHATIDWSESFAQGIPHVVYSYIHNVIETYPKDYVKSFAQELFVIAQKALHKK